MNSMTEIPNVNRCRCCLGASEPGGKRLIGRLRRRLQTCTGLRIETTSGLPQRICQVCIRRLHDAFDFRHHCLENDAYLHSRQSQISSAPEVKNEAELNETEDSTHEWNDSDNSDESESDLPLTNLRTMKIELDKSSTNANRNDFFNSTDGINIPNNYSELETRADNSTVKSSMNTSKNQPEIVDNHVIDVELNNSKPVEVIPSANKSKTKSTPRKRDKQPANPLNKTLYYCDICGHSVKIKYDLIAHFRRHTGEKPYKCNECGKQFAYDAGLRSHKKQHTGQKSFVCDMCGKGLSTKETLLAHRRLHTGELPYTCPTCGRAFRALTNLRSHKKIHTGDKRHPCPVCNKMFYTKSDMRNHARRHTGERPYACSLCPKRFTGKSNYRLHMKIHAGQKDFQCPYCPKSFVSRDSMRRHGRIHTGERSFECKECGRRFAHRSTLISHQAIHSKTKDYICDICSQRFGYPSGLYVHRKKKHNIQSSRMIMPIE